MKRRLLIAKALVHKPKLLLLDEPTAGVDIDLRSSLWEFVEELKQGGMSILLTTHYLEEAEQLCDRVGILQNGKLRKVGPTKELIEQLTKREVLLIFKSEAPAPINSPYLTKLEKHQAHFLIPPKLGIGDPVNKSIFFPV